MNFDLSVIIPAHNTQRDNLLLMLDSLRAQTLSTSQWELIVVDNASEPPLATWVDMAWHPHSCIVQEGTLGLTHARLAGFSQAIAEIIVLVDDDNILATDYLEQVLKIANEFTFIGAWGGVIEPRYESPELKLPKSLHPLLTLRNAAYDRWSNDPDHHTSTPWGAGLCVRRRVTQQYAEELRLNPKRLSLDLNGRQLFYGGDTDIAYTACRLGLGKGVFTALRLEHLIPANRCKPDYLCRVAEGRGYSEILHHYVLCNSLPPQRPAKLDWVRRMKRRLSLSPLERQVDAAYERGRQKACMDLAPVSKVNI